MLRGMKPEATKTTLAAILDKARAAHLPVLLAGMRAAPNLGGEYAGEFSAIYSALAKSYDVSLYPFFLDGVAGDPKLDQPDGLHPNAARGRDHRSEDSAFGRGAAEAGEPIAAAPLDCASS